MKLSEAVLKARRELRDLEDNRALIASTPDLAAAIRERGSRVEQRHDERGGKVSGRYIESVPAWLLQVENVERAVWELTDATMMTGAMVDYLQECEPEYYEYYKSSWVDCRTIPELKAAFPKREKLERELIFRLIYWHGWRIDADGGEEFWRWFDRRDR